MARIRGEGHAAKCLAFVLWNAATRRVQHAERVEGGAVALLSAALEFLDRISHLALSSEKPSQVVLPDRITSIGRDPIVRPGTRRVRRSVGLAGFPEPLTLPVSCIERARR